MLRLETVGKLLAFLDRRNNDVQFGEAPCQRVIYAVRGRPWGCKRRFEFSVGLLDDLEVLYPVCPPIGVLPIPFEPIPGLLESMQAPSTEFDCLRSMLGCPPLEIVVVLDPQLPRLVATECARGARARLLCQDLDADVRVPAHRAAYSHLCTRERFGDWQDLVEVEPTVLPGRRKALADERSNVRRRAGDPETVAAIVRHRLRLRYSGPLAVELGAAKVRARLAARVECSLATA